jgi:hypothetical protein
MRAKEGVHAIEFVFCPLLATLPSVDDGHGSVWLFTTADLG